MVHTIAIVPDYMYIISKCLYSYIQGVVMGKRHTLTHTKVNIILSSNSIIFECLKTGDFNYWWERLDQTVTQGM